MLCAASSSPPRFPAANQIQRAGPTGAAPHLLPLSSAPSAPTSSRKAGPPPTPSAVSLCARTSITKTSSAPLPKRPVCLQTLFVFSSALRGNELRETLKQWQNAHHKNRVLPTKKLAD